MEYEMNKTEKLIAQLQIDSKSMYSPVNLKIIEEEIEELHNKQMKFMQDQDIDLKEDQTWKHSEIIKNKLGETFQKLLENTMSLFDLRCMIGGNLVWSLWRTKIKNEELACIKELGLIAMTQKSLIKTLVEQNLFPSTRNKQYEIVIKLEKKGMIERDSRRGEGKGNPSPNLSLNWHTLKDMFNGYENAILMLDLNETKKGKIVLDLKEKTSYDIIFP